MLRSALIVAGVLLMASAAPAAQIWESTFDSDPDGVADIYNLNTNKVMIGAASGGTLSILAQDSSVAANLDKVGRPLGYTLDGHAEYSGLFTFQYASLPALSTQTYSYLGFIGPNSGTARQVVGAVMRNWTVSGHQYAIIGVSWGSSTGGSRSKNSATIDLGTNPIGQTFQVAIGYQGDYNLNTNAPDTGTANMYVALYNAAGTLLAEVVQKDVTAGDTGQTALLTGTTPATPYPTFLSNQQITHLGMADYYGSRNNAMVEYRFDSMAWYDSRDDAKGAVTPEPASALLLIAALGILGRRARRLEI